MALSLAAASAAGEEASWRLQARRTAPPQSNIATTDSRGPLRYSEQHWLAALKRTAISPRHARRIFLTSAGHAYVPAAEDRREILGLRHDIVIAGQVAFVEAKANAAILRDRLGRWPTVAELHAAHLLGAAGAAQMVLGAAGDRHPPASASWATSVHGAR